MLTKRAERLAELAPRLPWPQNLWMGVSIESAEFLYRAELLKQTPATIKFLSLEPLLGPLENLNLNRIDWVIAGGESGERARPMEADWARSIHDQCTATHTPFFFKQWGGRNKRAAGRTPDGRIWSEFPAKSA